MCTSENVQSRPIPKAPDWKPPDSPSAGEETSERWWVYAAEQCAE